VILFFVQQQGPLPPFFFRFVTSAAAGGRVRGD
jgi:hypothetical protein